MKINELLNEQELAELSYPGNIGIMELAKFFNIATPEQKLKFNKLKADGNMKGAWEYMQTVVGVKLHETNLTFEATYLTTEDEVIEYMKRRDKMLREDHGIQHSYNRNWRRSSSTVFRLVENKLPAEQNQFLQKFNSYDEYNKLNIKVGSKVAILSAEVSGEQFNIWGFTTPKTITKIYYTDDEDHIKLFEFNNNPDDTWPRLKNAVYQGQYLNHSIFLKSKQSAEHALTMLGMSVPSEIELKLHVKESKVRWSMNEGGWANPLTQGTHITPQLVDSVFKVLHVFVKRLNVFLNDRDIPPVELGYPCGSTTYYKRDLVQNPTREYGDIDVNLFIPRIEGMTNNANADVIRKATQEFCEGDPDFQTSNGTNVIVKVGNDYIQVDLITAFYHNKEWTTALAPEYNVKGVLCNSIYSSLGEALNLSIGGGHGVQGKMDDSGNLVPFKTVKDVKLKTITNNPKTWAVDIAKFFGCKKLHPTLKQYPGMLDEVRVSDMINSIKGIAYSLQLNEKGAATELLQKIKAIYLGKIEKGIMSSKYDKAVSPEAKAKAEHTKEMLATKSAEFAAMFD